MSVLKDLLIAIDVRLGRLVALEQPLTTVDKNLDWGGVYTAEEWQRTRRSGFNALGEGASAISNDNKYLNRMLCAEGRKLLAALSLVRNFDFHKYSSVIEIGCGEMIQAFVFKEYFPHIHYLATDFDIYIIEKCSQLPLLGGIEKAHIDVIEDDLEIFDKFDLIIAWTVDYALDHSTLIKLFCSAHKHSTSILLCTQQIIGLMRYVSRKIRMGSFNSQKLLKDGARLHGWCRSLRYWNKIADIASMRMEVISSPSRKVSRDAAYHYVLFTPIKGE